MTPGTLLVRFPAHSYDFSKSPYHPLVPLCTRYCKPVSSSVRAFLNLSDAGLCSRYSNFYRCTCIPYTVQRLSATRNGNAHATLEGWTGQSEAQAEPEARASVGQRGRSRLCVARGWEQRYGADCVTVSTNTQALDHDPSSCDSNRTDTLDARQSTYN